VVAASSEGCGRKVEKSKFDKLGARPLSGALQAVRASGAPPLLAQLRRSQVKFHRHRYNQRSPINTTQHSPKFITLAALVENGCRPPFVGSHMSLDGLRDAYSREKKNEIA
jgi:hypothetical protein